MVWRKEKNLKIGDLVYHVLYGREWLGLVLKIEHAAKTGGKVLVKMLPGTEYENHFLKRPSKMRESASIGWVSENWLIRIVPKGREK